MREGGLGLGGVRVRVRESMRVRVRVRESVRGRVRLGSRG